MVLTVKKIQHKDAGQIGIFLPYSAGANQKLKLIGAHYSKGSVQKVMAAALEKSGLSKKGSVHNLHHSFATHLLEAGTDIRYIQELPGHSSIKTTMIYTHITNKAINRIQSPLDRLNLKTDEKTDKKV